LQSALAHVAFPEAYKNSSGCLLIIARRQNKIWQ